MCPPPGPGTVARAAVRSRSMALRSRPTLPPPATVRRPRTPIVAAAKRIRVGEPRGLVAQVIHAAETWQPLAWSYYDETPEVHFAVNWTGAAFAKLRLHIGYLDPLDPSGVPQPTRDADGLPVEGIDAEVLALAEQELGRLRAPIGGQSEILRTLNMNLEVAGEVYLVGRQEQTVVVEVEGVPISRVIPESWEVRSIEEVVLQDTKVAIKDGPSGTPVPLAEGDVAIRIYQRHPRWSSLPDSAVRGVMRECKALDTLTKLVVAEANSKRAAGILLLPNEVVVVATADPEDGPQDPDLTQGVNAVNEIMQAISDATADAIEDAESPAAVAPIVIRGPGEFLDKVRLVTLARSNDQTLDDRIEKRVRRVARGLNVPVEVVEGHMATTFANAEQIDRDAFEDHLEPRCVMVVDALTSVYLFPNLTDLRGVPEEKARPFVVWFDASALINQPDTESHADVGLANGSLSWKAWRDACGYTEDDAPSPEEMLVRMALRSSVPAQAVGPLLTAGGFPIEVDLPAAPAPGAPAPGGEPADSGAAALVAAWLAQRTPVPIEVRGGLVAARRRPLSVGRRMAEVDRDLRARLLVASNDAMNRALERAGNRAKARTASALRAQVDQVRPVEVIHTLGRAGLAVAMRGSAAEELLDGAWDDLEEVFYRWGAQAQATALDLASQAVAGLSTGARESLGLRQATSLQEAWGWMRGALDAQAVSRMFDPNPGAPSLGEFDEAMRVPAGMVRQALARAGGAQGLVSAGKDGMWVTLSQGGTQPAGGIATGGDVMDTLRDYGVGVEGYRWVYGPAPRRTFEPHADLDGYEFTNFDDPGLANTDSFPPGPFYLPGDHDGCLCDFEPVILAAEAAA